jgi:hypothetical protein
MSQESPFFQFEADFVESLRCIPMQVRFKLDTCGVKLKLSHWHQFSQIERQQLVEMPCQTPDDIQAYRDSLHRLVLAHNGSLPSNLPIEDSPAWLNDQALPAIVAAKAQDSHTSISVEQWQTLTPLQRFVLIKLSRPSHENRNFLPAMREFDLA